MHVIGITGPFASGKGEVVKILREQGFRSYSLSDILRKLLKSIPAEQNAIAATLDELGFQSDLLPDIVDEISRQNILFREKMQNLGDALRHEYHPAILALLTGQAIKTHESNQHDTVIDSIRNPAELLYLREEFEAKIIGVTAPDEKRFNLILGRKRLGDPQTPDEFKILNKRERGLGQASHGQKLDACLQLADTIINNNGTLEEFHREIYETLRGWGIEGTQKGKERDY